MISTKDHFYSLWDHESLINIWTLLCIHSKNIFRNAGFWWINNKFGWSTPIGGWTEIGHEVQSLSNVCPKFVQHLSKYRPCPVPVQQCQDSVQCLSSMPRLCPMAVKSTSKLNPLDRHWTWKSKICPHFVQLDIMMKHPTIDKVFSPPSEGRKEVQISVQAIFLFVIL